MKHKLLGYSLLALVLYMLVTNPTGSADTAKAIGSGLATVADSIGAFFTALAPGGGQ